MLSENAQGELVSIHAPREGCDVKVALLTADGLVSIHAPREGCDGDARDLLLEDFRFNSRTPGGVRLLVR